MMDCVLSEDVKNLQIGVRVISIINIREARVLCKACNFSHSIICLPLWKLDVKIKIDKKIHYISDASILSIFFYFK